MPVALRRVRRSVGPYVLLLFVWYGVALLATSFRSVAFPTPWATVVTFVQLLFGRSPLSGEYYNLVGTSLGRFVDGFVVAAIVGVGIGCLLGSGTLLRRGADSRVDPSVDPSAGSWTGARSRSEAYSGADSRPDPSGDSEADPRTRHRTFAPPVDSGTRLSRLYAGERLARLGLGAAHALQTIPSLAWLPVTLLLFGREASAIPLLVALACVFVVTTATVEGIHSIEVLHVRAARMLGAKGGRLLFGVVLPGAAPYVGRGLCTGVVWSWWTLVGAELVLAPGDGLGAVLYGAGEGTPEFTFAIVMTITIIGVLMGHTVQFLTRRASNRPDSGEEAA